MVFVSGSLGPAELVEKFSRLAGDYVRSGDNLDVREVLVSARVRVGDSACSYYTDSDLIHGNTIYDGPSAARRLS